MIIESVYDPAFQEYGQVHKDFAVKEILDVLSQTPVTEGVVYTAEDASLQSLPDADTVSVELFGGMPVQLGWCNGHNTKLNCLEYHRDSEFNLGTRDFILLLAKQSQITEGHLNTADVKAFCVPAGVMVEVYATSLHYAPCQTTPDGFQVLVALPKGTNSSAPEIACMGADGGLLWACNKWLIAHKDAPEAQEGAFVGLIGENIDIAAV